MKILVTGSTGFIGSQLCRALTAQGHQVFALHRPSSSLRGLEGLPVELVTGDITYPETLVAPMQGMEVVFHVAALLGSNRQEQMYAVTVEGTRAVLSAAQSAGVRRVVHTSSVAALGVPESGPAGEEHPLPIDENHTWNYPPGRWRYGYAKYLAEMEVQKAVADGLDVVIVNPSIVIGAGDLYRASSSIIMQVARGKIPAGVAGGLNIVHIDDVVAGHLAAMERGHTGERYILSGANLPTPGLLNLIADVAGVRPPRGILPVGLTRAFGTLMRWNERLVSLPIGSDELRLAGVYFYYDNRKALQALGLPDTHTARQAVEDAYTWFTETMKTGPDG